MVVRSITFCVLFGLTCSAIAENYPTFRGPSGNGIVAEANPPMKWSPQDHVAWKTKLPGSGWSQPVIVGKTLFLTLAKSDGLEKPKDMQAGVKDSRSMPFFGGGKAPNVTIQWQLLALDAERGQVLWSKTVVEGKPKNPIHPSNTYATETPCADADRVYAYFGATGSLAAYDHQGKFVWKQELGAYKFSNGFGSGSSPILHDGKLFLASFNEEKSFVAAFDAKTGQEIWRQPRAKNGSAWATPLVWKNSQRTEIIACGDKLVTSHDPVTGEEFWRLGSLDTAFAPSPAVDGDLLILAASSPFSTSPIYAVKSGAKGDISVKKGETVSDSVLWHRTGSGVGMASPVAKDGYLYIPGEGALICVDTKTGKQLYKERLPRSRMVAASPIIAKDALLVLDETGKANWVKTGPAFKVLETNELADTFWATPAIVNDRIYLRGLETLYCIQGISK